MKNIASSKSKSTLFGIEEGDTQPNAVDLRVDKIFKIGDSQFTVTEEEKIHRKGTAVSTDEDGFYNLTPGHYEVIMKNRIIVAEGEAGFVITRSTLNRNGVFITSGLYDSGYGNKDEEGAIMAGVMHVNCGDMKIKPGTRIGQYLSFEAETLHSYDGSYGTKDGHDAKYA